MCCPQQRTHRVPGCGPGHVRTPVRTGTGVGIPCQGTACGAWHHLRPINAHGGWHGPQEVHDAQMSLLAPALTDKVTLKPAQQSNTDLPASRDDHVTQCDCARPCSLLDSRVPVRLNEVSYVHLLHPVPSSTGSSRLTLTLCHALLHGIRHTSTKTYDLQSPRHGHVHLCLERSVRPQSPTAQLFAGIARSLCRFDAISTASSQTCPRNHYGTVPERTGQTRSPGDKLATP